MQARILEYGERGQCGIHSYQDRSLEARRIERIDWVAEAERHDDIDCHAAKSVIQICALRRLNGPLDCCAEFFRFLYT